MSYQDLSEIYINPLLEQAEEQPLPYILKQIPLEVGSVKAEEKKTRQGICWFDWEMRWERDMHVEKKGNADTDTIQLIFFLNHGMNWEMEHLRQPVSMEAGECCIYRDAQTSSIGDYPGGHKMLFKSLQIPVNVFDGLVGDILERDAGDRMKRILAGFHKMTMTPDMYRMIREVNNAGRYQNGLASLFLEGKILELLTVFLDTLMQPCHGIKAENGLSRTDLLMLLEIKDRIDKDSASVPGISQLAKEVHVSPSKLTKGFKKLTGTSLHAYVIDQRLHHAASLLEEGQMNVSEAAMCSGYSNMSHFSAAFRKKYGVLPKNYPVGKC